MSTKNSKNIFNKHLFDASVVPENWPPGDFGRQYLWDNYNVRVREKIVSSLSESNVDFTSLGDTIEIILFEGAIKLRSNGTWEFEW